MLTTAEWLLRVERNSTLEAMPSSPSTRCHIWIRKWPILMKRTKCLLRSYSDIMVTTCRCKSPSPWFDFIIWWARCPCDGIWACIRCVCGRWWRGFYMERCRMGTCVRFHSGRQGRRWRGCRCIGLNILKVEREDRQFVVPVNLKQFGLHLDSNFFNFNKNVRKCRSNLLFTIIAILFIQEAKYTHIWTTHTSSLRPIPGRGYSSFFLLLFAFIGIHIHRTINSRILIWMHFQ